VLASLPPHPGAQHEVRRVRLRHAELAIGALQAMLDRGEQLDWFGSLEIRIEALICVIAFAYFIVHTATAGEVVLPFRVAQGPQFRHRACFIFVIGAVMYATRAAAADAAEPDGLSGRHHRAGYRAERRGHDDRDDAGGPPAAARGCAAAPAGRLPDLGLRAVADDGLHHRAVGVGYRRTGIIQGFGLGLVFVPLSALTFSTLEPPCAPMARPRTA
jgi:DHA2 family multidrug resistance protein